MTENERSDSEVTDRVVQCRTIQLETYTGSVERK